MKRCRYILALLMACALTPLAIAQSNNMVATTTEPYVPRLGDLMAAIQWRHIKLWFSGKALNWQLAAFELGQLKPALAEAAMMYEGIPVTNVTTMSQPIDAVAAAIEARDSKRFAKAVGELTDGCNACHKSIGRGFFVIRVPSEQPFSNQVFPPQGRP